MEFLMDMAAAMVNRIPYAFSNDLVMISPADVLYLGPKWDYIPQTKSRLKSINDMISNLRIHKKEMERIRNDHLIWNLRKHRSRQRRLEE